MLQTVKPVSIELSGGFSPVNQALLISTNLTAMNTNICIMLLTFWKSAFHRIVLIGLGQPFCQRSFDNIIGGHSLYQLLERIKVLCHKLLIRLIAEGFPAELSPCALDHSQHKFFIFLKAVPVPRHIDYIKTDSAYTADTLIFLSEEDHKAFLTLRLCKSAAAEAKNVDKNGSAAV